jgi:hypothetical protein
MEFSELAIQKLLQLFPELSSLIVTFKDITDEVPSLEDTDISIGVFILETGGEYFYLPIIAKGESIQPLDSVFNLKEQSFVPLTKGFINRVVTSAQVNIGKPKKIPDTVIQNPSIYSLVTPPRTGKFVYASSSRLEEFLTVLPNMVKKAVLDEISTDKEVYSVLHKLFGLENLISALKPISSPIIAVPKPTVEIVTEGIGLDNSTIKDILSKGYALRGENTTTRVAVPANLYKDVGKFRVLSSIDAGQDFDICTKTGETVTAFLPKNSKYRPQTPALFKNKSGNIDNVLAIFKDGTYTVSSSLVATYEGRTGHQVVKDYLTKVPAVTPNEISNQDTNFALFSPELELIGLYQYPRITKTAHGVTIQAMSVLDIGTNNSETIINAYRNCLVINTQDPKNIFIPYNTLIVKLGKKLWAEDVFESNINSALARQELATQTTLGSAIDIGHDGIEFIVNKQPVGCEANVMKILVVEEGINPYQAESFIKQAKERKHMKIYMSKKADSEQDIIPSYGLAPPPQQGGFGINGDFSNSLMTAAKTNDAEVIESTIISELLQVADMKGYIREYLPEIKNSIDKLGRALFLSRLKIDQLALDHTASEVFSFIGNLRNTYRMLGDTYLKLEDMVSNSEVEVRDKK